MIFDWSGLKDNLHFILKQNSDPLKYCNYFLPFPMPLGLPFMPCDLPNSYELHETDPTYEELGSIYLSFEEETSLLHRIVLPASHRPWTIVGKDYYNHVPYKARREINCCLTSYDRPTVQVFYEDRYIGRVTERTILNCCCLTEVFQQFQIYDEKGELSFLVSSRNPQRGHFLIFPWWGFDRIRYNIVKIKPDLPTENIDQPGEADRLLSGLVVGEIAHLFNGMEEYTSKNDKYGISLPTGSTEEEKCLLIYCTLFIDYLLFGNF